MRIIAGPWKNLARASTLVAVASIGAPSLDAAAQSETNWSTFGVAGAKLTYVHGRNDNGFVTGEYLDGNDVSHGYVRSPDGKIKSFDPAGSVGTASKSINNKNTIAGDYVDGGGRRHGFLRSADGTITEFDVVQSTNTHVGGINGKGVIAGSFDDSDHHGHG